MPSFNFSTGGFNGSGNGGIGSTSSGSSWGGSGGGWQAIASQGLNLLGGWAMNRAAVKAQNRASAQMVNPYLNQNPNLGAAPSQPFFSAPNPNLPTTQTPWGWPLNNPQPLMPGGRASDQGWDTGFGVLDDWLDETTGNGPRGGNVASPVVIDQNGMPCVVRKPPPPRLIGAVNNATGKSAFYRYVGAPILFRGDLATLKTVKKAVSRFGGLAGARRPFRARSRRR